MSLPPSAKPPQTYIEAFEYLLVQFVKIGTGTSWRVSATTAGVASASTIPHPTARHSSPGLGTLAEMRKKTQGDRD